MKKKLTFYEKLYLGESISEKKLDKIKRMLVKNPLTANVFVIVPAHNPNDQLDIFDARQLIQPHYSKMSFHIIGIAADYKEALSLVERMVQDCLSERGDCKLREYLSC